MPGTHLLPPNLLKLFNPRPPLQYYRPVDKDIDPIKPKNVDGVAAILAALKEDQTTNLINSGKAQRRNRNQEDGDDEEGAVEEEESEDQSFTHAEETKRQLRREERKRRKQEAIKIAKETCEDITIYLHLSF